jgi:phage I-like protein
LICNAVKPLDNDLMMLLCKDLAGVVPAEIQVVPAGFHQTPKGDFLCDEESAASVISAFDSQINDMVIDYEHQTLTGGEAPASGWIKKLINKGSEGIWAAVEWTDKARERIANKEYKYVSPVFLKRISDNKVIRLINVALTNQPNIDGMVPLINKQTAISNQRSAEETKKEEGTMFKELLKLLGLQETATETEAIAAFNTVMANKAAIVANKAVFAALGVAETASESEVVATIMANKQGHDLIEKLTLQVNKLTDELKTKADGDIEEMVNKAIAGDDKGAKITPAQKDWALGYAKTDLEGFKLFLNKAPYQVLRGQKAPEDDGKNQDKVILDAAQMQVNKIMGVDDETFKKFAPKEK